MDCLDHVTRRFRLVRALFGISACGRRVEVITIARPGVPLSGQRLLATGTAPQNDGLRRGRLASRVLRASGFTIINFRLRVKDRVTRLSSVAAILAFGVFFLSQLGQPLLHRTRQGQYNGGHYGRGCLFRGRRFVLPFVALCVLTSDPGLSAGSHV